MNGRQIIAIALRAAVLFALFLLGWRWLQPLYAGLFRFATDVGFGLLGFEDAVDLRRRAPAIDGLDTTVFVDRDACSVFLFTPVNSWFISFVPSALVGALVLATPWPWWQRAKALAIGLGLVHAYAMVRVALVVLQGMIEHLPHCTGSHPEFVTSASGREWCASLQALLHREPTVYAFVPLVIWMVLCALRLRGEGGKSRIA